MIRRWLSYLPTVAVLTLATPALAQDTGRVPNEDSGYIQWLVAIGLAAVILVTAFINPKRSHMT